MKQQQTPHKACWAIYNKKEGLCCYVTKSRLQIPPPPPPLPLLPLPLPPLLSSSSLISLIIFFLLSLPLCSTIRWITAWGLPASEPLNVLVQGSRSNSRESSLGKGSGICILGTTVMESFGNSHSWYC